jgi:hypothetical protein
MPFLFDKPWNSAQVLRVVALTFRVVRDTGRILAHEPATGFPGLWESQCAAVCLIVAAIGDGRRLAAVTGPPGTGQSFVLDTVASAIKGLATQILRIDAGSEPMRLERLVDRIAYQSAAADYSTRIRQAREALLGPEESGTRTVLLVDNAHMLQQDALYFLQLTSDRQAPDRPRLQIIFAGEPSFWSLLDFAALNGLRDQIEVRAGLARPAAEAAEMGTQRKLAGRVPGVAGRLRSRVRALTIASAAVGAVFAIVAYNLLPHHQATPAQVVRAGPNHAGTPALSLAVAPMMIKADGRPDRSVATEPAARADKPSDTGTDGEAYASRTDTHAALPPAMPPRDTQPASQPALTGNGATNALVSPPPAPSPTSASTVSPPPPSPEESAAGNVSTSPPGAGAGSVPSGRPASTPSSVVIPMIATGSSAAGTPSPATSAPVAEAALMADTVPAAAVAPVSAWPSPRAAAPAPATPAGSPPAALRPSSEEDKVVLFRQFLQWRRGPAEVR